MSKKLVSAVETYRLDDEFEVDQFLQELKKDASFEIAKYTSVKKEKKSKGEVVDDWIRFTVTKKFASEVE